SFTQALWGRHLPIVLILLLCYCSSTAFAMQPNTNSSITVLSEQGEPVVSAVVRITPIKNEKAPELMGLTEPDGKFFFEFTEPVIIKVSYIGYTTLIDTFQSAGNKTYHMKPDSKSLNDVVVTGSYVSKRVNESVYSVKIIDNDMLRAK